MATLVNRSLKTKSEDSKSRSLRYAALRQERLAACLAMIAGFVDAYGIIYYNTYLSFMSGNTTQTGYKIGQGEIAAAVPSALAILFFVVGTFTGTLLAHSAVRRSRRVVLILVAASLALIFCFTQLGFLSGGVHISVISFAMGLSNTALSRVGAESVNLTFVTGTLNKLGVHLAMALKHLPVPDSQGTWDTHMYRVLILAGIWTSFLAGALLSGAATLLFGVWVLLFPMLLLSLLAAFDRTASKSA
jgi:uncharacterized membrane protein YoaK (UPF0700 family)